MPATTEEISALQTSASEVPAKEPVREVPKWALVVGLVAFLIFNTLFLVFAMSLGSGNPG